MFYKHQLICAPKAYKGSKNYLLFVNCFRFFIFGTVYLTFLTKNVIGG